VIGFRHERAAAPRSGIWPPNSLRSESQSTLILVSFLFQPRFFAQFRAKVCLRDFLMELGLELARISFRFFETLLPFIEKFLLFGTIIWPRKSINSLFERITLIVLQHCEHRFA
jgi:hypothetical protein